MSKGEAALTKARILESAEILFASKGFHGTRVDEIAMHAEVNKATIYYYFPSKQAILEQLTASFLTDFMDAASAILTKGDKAGFFPNYIGVTGGDKIIIRDEGGLKQIDSLLENWLNSLLCFFKTKRNILRIMFMESMMDGENQCLPFRLSDIIASGSSFPDIYEKLGLKKLNDETIILKFFGGLMPLALCAVYEDAWIEHYRMPKDMLYQGMLTLFRIEIMGYFSFNMADTGEAYMADKKGTAFLANGKSGS